MDGKAAGRGGEQLFGADQAEGEPAGRIILEKQFARGPTERGRQLASKRPGQRHDRSLGSAHQRGHRQRGGFGVTKRQKHPGRPARRQQGLAPGVKFHPGRAPRVMNDFNRFPA